MPITDKLLKVKTELLQESEEYIRSKRLRQLFLVGDITRSPFLRSVWRCASGYGMTVSCWTPVARVPDAAAAVADFEHLSCAPDAVLFVKSQDIDCSYYDGVSACAEATAALLSNAVNLHGKHVLIIGRGHAVKGLPRLLIKQNAAVSVVHSKSSQKLVQELCKTADVVINAAPSIPYFLSCKGLLLDIGNVANYEAETYFNDIGMLTTAYLLRRCTMRGGCDE